MNIDIGKYKALFGVRQDELAKDIPPASNKKGQASQVGGTLWQQGVNGIYQFMPVILGGVPLWAPQIRLTGRKTIVETQLVERKGSVKEIISTDDYIINIRGIIKRQDGLWPEQELAQLISLYERNEAVEIESAITNRVLNGIEYVVITNIQLPGKPGFVESIPYEIECVVDIPFVLELDQDGNESTQ